MVTPTRDRVIKAMLDARYDADQDNLPGVTGLYLDMKTFTRLWQECRPGDMDHEMRKFQGVPIYIVRVVNGSLDDHLFVRTT